MHIYSMHINLLGLPRPKLRRGAALKVFPSGDEIFPCVLIAIGILLGILAAIARIF
jgi:hypothetical protein